MKKIFLLLTVVLIIFCCACSGWNRDNEIVVYYSLSGGSSNSIDIDGIEEINSGRMWEDPEAKMHRQIDFLGMTLKGDYMGTFQNDYRTLRDEYIHKEKDNTLSFTVDRKTSRILSYVFDYNRFYIWPEDQPDALLTQEECLSVAIDFLEQFTDLHSEYSLINTKVVDNHLTNWPVSYRYTFELSGKIYCDCIYVTVRSDGEMTEISQNNYIDKTICDAAKAVDLDTLYNYTDKAIKNKFGNKYNDYYIERIELSPELAISNSGVYNISVVYEVSSNKDDPYPNQIIVFVPIELCVAE